MVSRNDPYRLVKVKWDWVLSLLVLLLCLCITTSFALRRNNPEDNIDLTEEFGYTPPPPSNDTNQANQQNEKPQEENQHPQRVNQERPDVSPPQQRTIPQPPRRDPRGDVKEGQPPRQEDENISIAAPDSQLTTRVGTTMYIDPSETSVNVGDNFDVTVKISNRRNIGFATWGFVIRYDTDLLSVVDSLPDQLGVNIDDEQFADNFPRSQEGKGQYVNIVIENEGLILYRATSINPKIENKSSGNFAKISFTAIAPVNRADLKFVYQTFPADSNPRKIFGDSKLSTLILDKSGEDVLGNPFVSDDGALGATVSVLAEDSKTYAGGEEFGKNPFVDLETRIVMNLEKEKVKVGDMVVLHFELVNPRNITFDRLSIYLAYNKDLLMSIDRDDNNWITERINIYDGEFHDAFPFDIHEINEIDSSRGSIDYRMQGINRDLRSQGVFGTAYFKAKAPGKMRFRAFVHPDGKEPTTGIYLGDKDVLGRSHVPGDGIKTATIEILPLQFP